MPCDPCERSNAICDYFDTAKGQKISRSYVVHLQKRIKALEAECSQLESQHATTAPDVQGMLRSGGLVTLKENAETRYLGPSSGIAMTRIVMHFAKTQTQSASMQDIVSHAKARQIRDRFALELIKPTSKVYPLISSVAASDLPSRGLTGKLLEIFNHKAQFMLPTLHEPSLLRTVNHVYVGSMDPYQNFVLRIVLAVSMQKLDSRYAGLADSYYLAAMPYLEASIKRKDLGTLQCLALIAQYSMVTPTRTASYWVVGLACKLCQELGLTEETTIGSPRFQQGEQPDALEIDMRRRLFWIIFSMETGLAHSLGRPSAFACSYDHPNVLFFQAVDDEYIGKNGIVPGCPLSIKKQIAIHFLSMRLLQLEIRRKLYLRKKPVPKDNDDPWFYLMEQKLRSWVHSCPTEDCGTGLDEVWFKGRFNTMIIFLYRPSPQIPEPSLAAAKACFEACTFNVQMHRHQEANRSVDITWIWTQSTFLALNTLLWTLSYPEIRKQHSKMVVENHIKQAKECIVAAAGLWPGVEAAVALYEDLIDAYLRAYDNPQNLSVTIKPEPDEDGSRFYHIDASLPSRSSPSKIQYPVDSARPSEIAPLPSTFAHSRFLPSTANVSPSSKTYGSTDSSESPYVVSPEAYSSSISDTASGQDVKQVPLPTFNVAPFSTEQMHSITPINSYEHYFASMADPYFHYLQMPDLHQSSWPSLSQQQQVELMHCLESDGVGYG
ncbi:MAG: hypothetical protein Q9200_001949 [Gallowayella weberi]